MPSITWATSTRPGGCGISLDPNPFAAGKPFRQTLDLPTGSIRIEADGVTLRVWADANRPVYHVEIHSPREVAVAARPEFWKRFDHCDFNCAARVPRRRDAEPPQDVRLERNGKMLWYFAVGDRSVYPDDLKFYEVEQMAAQFPDPFRFNTFGNLLECPALKLKDGALRGTGKSFDIRIHALAMQTPKPRDVDRDDRAAGGAAGGCGAAIGRSTARGGRAFGSGVGSSLPTAPCRRRPARSSAASLRPAATATRRTARPWRHRATTSSAS